MMQEYPRTMIRYPVPASVQVSDTFEDGFGTGYVSMLFNVSWMCTPYTNFATRYITALQTNYKTHRKWDTSIGETSIATLIKSAVCSSLCYSSESDTPLCGRD